MKYYEWIKFNISEKRNNINLLTHKINLWTVTKLINYRKKKHGTTTLSKVLRNAFVKSLSPESVDFNGETV